MELTKFEESIDRLGPNVDTWENQSDRQQAQALLQSSESARELLREAQTVDELLPKALYVPTPQGLERRIMDVVVTTKPFARTWQRICTNWILKPALAVVPLALGFLIGFSQTQHSTNIEDEITTVHFEDYTNILFIAND